MYDLADPKNSSPNTEKMYEFLNLANLVAQNSFSTLFKLSLIDENDVEVYELIFSINFLLPYILNDNKYNPREEFNSVIEALKKTKTDSYNVKVILLNQVKTLYNIMKTRNYLVGDEIKCLANIIKEKEEAIKENLECSSNNKERKNTILKRFHKACQDSISNFKKVSNGSFGVSDLELQRALLPNIIVQSLTLMIKTLSFEKVTEEVYKYYNSDSVFIYKKINSAIIYEDIYLLNIIFFLYHPYHYNYQIPYLNEIHLDYCEKYISSVFSQNFLDIIQATHEQFCLNIGSSASSSKSFFFDYIMFFCPSDYKKELEAFLNKIYAINEKANDHQKRNLMIFLYKQHLKIIQIIKIMGLDGIKYMDSLLANTVLTLERVLEQTTVFYVEIQNQLHELYIALKESSEDTISYVCNFNSFIKLLNIFLNTAIDNNNDLSVIKSLPHFSAHIQVLEILLNKKIFQIDNKDRISEEELLECISFLTNQKEYNFQSENLSPIINVLHFLIEVILVKFFGDSYKELQINQENIFKLLQNISPDKLTKLFAATSHMASNSEYRSIYIRFLFCDFFDGKIDDMLYDVKSDDSTLQRLALHNENIKKILSQYEFDSDKLLSYKKTFEFTFQPIGNKEGSDNFEDSYTVLYSYFLKLNEKISCLSSQPFNGIKKQIEKLSKMIEKNKKKQFDKSNLKQINLSKAIVEKISKLDKNVTNEIKEFIEHILEQDKLLSTCQIHSNKKISKGISFTIKQWDKTAKDTFFLGDEVGCCLAPTSSQFHAMVQRRMDDAMFFHVAVNNNTNKPVALIWLYLAETANKELVLIANFFEVATKFALDSELRIALLNALLKFTSDYCRENNNLKFYMNQLSYGWNKDDLKDYDLVNLNIFDKLGGPLVLDEENMEIGAKNKDITIQKYYLASLGKQNFHEFNYKKLNLKNMSIKEDNNNTEQLASKTPFDYICKDNESHIDTIKEFTNEKQKITFAKSCLFYCSTKKMNMLNNDAKIITSEVGRVLCKN